MVVPLGAELSAQTFCTFQREFSSIRRQPALTGNDPDCELGPADLYVPRAIPGSPSCGADCTSPGRSAQSAGQALYVHAAASVKWQVSQTPIG